MLMVQVYVHNYRGTNINIKKNLQRLRTDFDASTGNMLNLVLTSFLSWGKRKGSLTLSPDTIVRTGSKQRKTAPMISIFPSLGSTGSMDKNFPEWILQKEKRSENNEMTNTFK